MKNQKCELPAFPAPAKLTLIGDWQIDDWSFCLSMIGPAQAATTQLEPL